jgi:ribosome-associated translation inhibitor RaiA
MEVRVTRRGQVPALLDEEVQRQIGPLDRRVRTPILDAHVVLTQEENPRIERPARAEAEIDLNGHIIRGRVAGVEMRNAVDLLAEHLRAQLRRFVESRITAHRRTTHPTTGEWRHGQWSAPRPGYLPRPAEERELTRRKAFSIDAITPVEAAELMADLDHDFLLFRDADTDADAVVYVREGRLGVIEPAGTELPQPTEDAVEYEQSRLSDPITLDAAVAEMNELNHHFLYFVNAETGRGNVIYLRHDGHYGLIEPGPPSVHLERKVSP